MPTRSSASITSPSAWSRRLREERGFAPGLTRRIHDHFKRIDDVRPLFASFHWAYYAAERVGAELGELVHGVELLHAGTDRLGPRLFH